MWRASRGAEVAAASRFAITRFWRASSTITWRATGSASNMMLNKPPMSGTLLPSLVSVSPAASPSLFCKKRRPPLFSLRRNEAALTWPDFFVGTYRAWHEGRGDKVG